MNDTSPKMTAKMREMIRAKSPEERLRMGCSMYDFSKQLVASSILRENPGLSPDSFCLELFQKFYGNDFDAIQKQKIIDYLSHDLPQKGDRQHDISPRPPLSP